MFISGSICSNLLKFSIIYKCAQDFIVQPLPNHVVITKHDVNYNDKVTLNNNFMAILKPNNIVSP